MRILSARPFRNVPRRLARAPPGRGTPGKSGNNVDALLVFNLTKINSRKYQFRFRSLHCLHTFPRAKANFQANLVSLPRETRVLAAPFRPVLDSHGRNVCARTCVRNRRGNRIRILTTRTRRKKKKKNDTDKRDLLIDEGGDDQFSSSNAVFGEIERRAYTGGSTPVSTQHYAKQGRSNLASCIITWHAFDVRRRGVRKAGRTHEHTVVRGGAENGTRRARGGKRQRLGNWDEKARSAGSPRARYSPAKGWCVVPNDVVPEVHLPGDGLRRRRAE